MAAQTVTASKRGASTKRCSRCRKWKPLASFSKNRARYDGLANECKACRSEIARDYRERNPDKIQTANARFAANNPGRFAAWSRANPEKRRAHRLKSKFGITVDEYDQQLAEQGGGCAICGQPCKSGRNLAVDHDHESGELRGLLCTPCNVGLGAFRDNPDLLRKAITYIA